MNIVMSAIWYPVAIARYFLAALKRRDDVRVVTAGIATQNWIPWAGGMTLPDSYVYNPDIKLPKSAAGRGGGYPLSLIEAQLPPDFTPDLWIQVDAGFHLDGRPTNGRNVIIGTDPHVLNYERQRRIADDFYCMQRIYAKQGDKYLPYAYDPVWHAPIERNGTIEFDIAVAGAPYAQRRQLLARFSDYKTYCQYGLAYEDVRDLYAKSIMSFNLSTRNDLTARVFELAAMGVPFVANIVPDLGYIFGDAIQTFESLDAGEWLIRRFLDNESMRLDAVAKAAAAVAGHTWDARIGMVIDEKTYE